VLRALVLGYYRLDYYLDVHAGRDERLYVFRGPGFPDSRTAIDRPVIGPDSGGVVLNLFYKHSRIKQYLKDGGAMRIETVVNAPRDLGCNARLPNLSELQDNPVRATGAYWELSVPARAPSLRAQPLSGSRTRPRTRTGGGPRPCGLAILGSRPWPAPCAPPCSPHPALPARACAP
jgi:hypothetical protein